MTEVIGKLLQWLPMNEICHEDNTSLLEQLRHKVEFGFVIKQSTAKTTGWLKNQELLMMMIWGWKGRRWWRGRRVPIVVSSTSPNQSDDRNHSHNLRLHMHSLHNVYPGSCEWINSDTLERRQIPRRQLLPTVMIWFIQRMEESCATAGIVVEWRYRFIWNTIIYFEKQSADWPETRLKEVVDQCNPGGESYY